MTDVAQAEKEVKRTIWSSQALQTVILILPFLWAGFIGWNQISISKADIVELKQKRESDTAKISDMAGDIKAIRAVIERDSQFRRNP